MKYNKSRVCQYCGKGNAVYVPPNKPNSILQRLKDFLDGTIYMAAIVCKDCNHVTPSVEEREK